MNIAKALLISGVVSQGLPKIKTETPKLDTPKETITTPIPNPAVLPEISNYKNKDAESPKVYYVKIERDGLSEKNTRLFILSNAFLCIVLAGAFLKMGALKNANKTILKSIDFLRKDIKFHQNILDSMLDLNGNDDIKQFQENVRRILLEKSQRELTEVLGRENIV